MPTRVINDLQRARKVYGSVYRTPVLVSLQATESDASVLTLDWKESVRCASTANITLPPSPVIQTIDGVTVSNENRILLKNQTTSSENGIYVVNVGAGTWDRATDAIPGSTLTCGATTYVEEGTVNQGSKWLLSTTNVTLGGPQNWILFDRGNNWLVTGSLGGPMQMKTDDAVSIGADYPSNMGSDIFFFVSGTIGSSTNKKSVFGGDTIISGTLSVKTGVEVTGSILPGTDNTFTLGSANYRWSDIYTGDLHLRNDRGDWTLIEESEHLTVRNNKTGQLFRIEMNPVEE